jgi:hypothetical protein
VAAAIGAVLAIPFLRSKESRRLPWPLAAAHGAVGAVGVGILGIALWQGLPPSEMGTAGFGPAAAVLLGSALLLGLVMAMRRRRPATPLVAVHASLAVAGIVVLWALATLG